MRELELLAETEFAQYETRQQQQSDEIDEVRLLVLLLLLLLCSVFRRCLTFVELRPDSSVISLLVCATRSGPD